MISGLDDRSSAGRFANASVSVVATSTLNCCKDDASAEQTLTLAKFATTST